MERVAKQVCERHGDGFRHHQGEACVLRALRALPHTISGSHLTKLIHARRRFRFMIVHATTVWRFYQQGALRCDAR